MTEASFATFELAGPDAAAFLQGYLTADLDALGAVGERVALPTAYCNLKGRVLASGWAFGEASRVRVLLHASVAQDFAASLGKFLPFAKSQLSRHDGAGFRATPSPAAVELPPTGWFAEEGAGRQDEFAAACAGAGFVVVAKPVAEAFLPQMLGLTDVGAVSFAKGCYLGQEVVARAEHLGQVKQTLRRYRCDGEPPTVGADVVADDRKVGTVVAAGDGIVLAVVRGEAPTAAAGGRGLASELVS